MYNTEVRVWFMGGATPNPSTVTATLYLLETTIGSDNVAHDNDFPRQTLTVATSPFDALSVRAPLSFADGPSFYLPNDETRQIALTVNDPRFSGFIFRSGQLGTLPPGFPANPNGFIEVVVPEPQVISLAGPVSGVSLPMPIPDVPGGTVTGATITPGNGSFTLVAVGAVTTGPVVSPVVVTFTFTAAIGLSPSMSVRDTNKVFVADWSGKPSLTFAGGTLVDSVVAALLNFLEPVFLPQVLDTILSKITDAVNAKALAAVRNAMLAGNPQAGSTATICAQGVNLSADDNNSFSIAVGNFGKIFPPQQGGGSLCALSSALAILPTLQLGLFRAFRDNVLSRTQPGRDCIALYYKHSSEIVDRVLTDPQLAHKAAALVLSMERDLASQSALSVQAVEKLNRFLSSLATKCSAQLSSDLRVLLLNESRWRRVLA